MKSCLLIAVALATVTACSAVFLHGGKKEGTHKKWTCKGDDVIQNAEFMKAKKECHEEFKEAKEANTEGRLKGRTCKSVCALTKFGVFNEDGGYEQAQMEKLVDSMLKSEEAKEEIKKGNSVCATEYPDLGTHLEDKKCSNYKPFLKCIWLNAMKVCIPNFDAEDWD